ncbi:MAG: hypothetical protein HFH91_07160 [Lachnospiraceae bacterium]|nr:hypothetical protein [Lachnospiraceae bacterium]
MKIEEQVGRMKKYRKGILALIIWLMMTAGVCAQEGESVRLDDEGNIIISSSSMAEDEAATMSMTISVEAAETDNVEFLFRESGAQILEYRYNREEKKLQLYIAGVNSLFPAGTDSLTIGRIMVKDQNGTGISAKVKIEEGALAYVYGSEVRTPEGMTFPGTVQIGAGTGTPPPSDSGTSSGGGSSQGNSGSGGQEPGGDSGESGNTGQGTGGQKKPIIISPIPVSPTPVTPTPAPEEGEKEKDQDETQESDPDASSEETLPGSSETDKEADGEAAAGEKSGINWVIILAIGGIVIFAGVAIWAFVTLNRKPGS